MVLWWRLEVEQIFPSIEHLMEGEEADFWLYMDIDCDHLVFNILFLLFVSHPAVRAVISATIIFVINNRLWLWPGFQNQYLLFLPVLLSSHCVFSFHIHVAFCWPWPFFHFPRQLQHLHWWIQHLDKVKWAESGAYTLIHTLLTWWYMTYGCWFQFFNVQLFVLGFFRGSWSRLRRIRAIEALISVITLHFMCISLHRCRMKTENRWRRPRKEVEGKRAHLLQKGNDICHGCKKKSHNVKLLWKCCKMCLKMCPQDKMVLFSNRQNFYFEQGFTLGTQLQTNLNNKYINCFYSVSPFEQ